MENLEVVVTGDGKAITPINTQPVNIVAFDNLIVQWEQHARQMGAATESIMGESPTAGTPFKLQELITAESHSLHEYRKGKLATFLDEVYREWIIPHLAKEITNGQEFLAEFDLEELQTIADNLVICETNNFIKEMILDGQTIYPDDIEARKQLVRDEFMKKGNKHFIEILKNELKDAPISVQVNIVSKQKDLPAITDKLTNVWRTIVANPAVLQTPQMSKLFNQILEKSGLEPISFYNFNVPSPQATQQLEQPAEVAAA
jgi:hypothetical protein